MTIKKLFGRWMEGLGLGLVSSSITLLFVSQLITIPNLIFVFIAGLLFLLIGAFLQGFGE